MKPCRRASDILDGDRLLALGLPLEKEKYPQEHYRQASSDADREDAILDIFVEILA